MFKLKNKNKMKKITITYEIPEGYEFNEKALSFDNIFKKKNIEPIIRWVNGDVEINADGEHFLLDASNVTGISDWNDAKRYCKDILFKDEEEGQLPTINQLKVIHKYFDRINEVINENNGYLLYRGWYWSCEEKNEFCAWGVVMYNGNTGYNGKYDDNYVRAVSAL